MKDLKPRAEEKKLVISVYKTPDSGASKIHGIATLHLLSLYP